MRISGTEPSSVILSQTCSIKHLKISPFEYAHVWGRCLFKWIILRHLNCKKQIFKRVESSHQVICMEYSNEIQEVRNGSACINEPSLENLSSTKSFAMYRCMPYSYHDFLRRGLYTFVSL